MIIFSEISMSILTVWSNVEHKYLVEWGSSGMLPFPKSEERPAVLCDHQMSTSCSLYYDNEESYVIKLEN